MGKREVTTRERFIRELNGAPISLEAFAESAAHVEDCEQLATAAQDFLDAREHFELVLREAGVEAG